ncbi:uncharacterized protein LOC124256600 [Haliotis rubra]|uniref:uncharacterized protein LOC124256600 n=1 Tax=Haliotis rubra TaxID=36100 RepID=UPI001EE5D645|nr:uncharacterized protein LOC124256600 [Haliotis rubra]
MKLLLILLIGVLALPTVSGWWRRRPRHDHHHHHTHVCHCNGKRLLSNFASERLSVKERKLAKRQSNHNCCSKSGRNVDADADGLVSKREAAGVLNVEETDPDLDLLMQNARSKRDGMMNLDKFIDILMAYDY